jgi:hypothetical protein
MTIFPEKTKAGRPTGVWVVEVRKMTNGVPKTIRKRTRDHAEAIQIEASLRGSLGSEPRPRLPVPVQPSVTTPPYIGGRSYEPGGTAEFSLTDMTPLPQISTLRDLYEGAQSIYRGNKDEKQSCERLHAALEIIGWDVDVRDLRTPRNGFSS